MILLARGPFRVERIRVANLQMRTCIEGSLRHLSLNLGLVLKDAVAWRSVACRTGALGSLYYCQIGGQRCSDRGLIAGQLLLFDTGFPHSVPHDH